MELLQEGLFIYTGNRKPQSHYGYSDGSDNAGNISTYIYRGLDFTPVVFFGGGAVTVIYQRVLYL